MALAGALKALAKEEIDENSKVVIIFPDNIFKYASFFIKNFPELTQSSTQQPIQEITQEMVEKARTPENTLEPLEAKEIIENENPMVIDVRPSFMYSQGHLPKAINIPVQEINNRISELPKDKEAKIITVCNHGNASLHALLTLKSLGYNDIKSMNSGTVGWKEKGYPTE